MSSCELNENPDSLDIIQKTIQTKNNVIANTKNNLFASTNTCLEPVVVESNLIQDVIRDDSDDSGEEYKAMF